MARRQDQGRLLSRARRDGKSEIAGLDWKTLEYRPSQRPKFPALEMAKNVDDLPERLRDAAGAGRKTKPARSSGRHCRTCGPTRPIASARSPTRSSKSIAP